LPENWPIYPDPHSSPPLYLVIRGWPHDGGLPTRFRTEPKKIITVGLSGDTGGKMKELCDYCICVPSNITPRIQECHILIGHIICAIVEKEIFGEGF